MTNIIKHSAIYLSHLRSAVAEDAGIKPRTVSELHYQPKLITTKLSLVSSKVGCNHLIKLHLLPPNLISSTV